MEGFDTEDNNKANFIKFYQNIQATIAKQKQSKEYYSFAEYIEMQDKGREYAARTGYQLLCSRYELSLGPRDRIIGGNITGRKRRRRRRKTEKNKTTNIKKLSKRRNKHRLKR